MHTISRPLIIRCTVLVFSLGVLLRSEAVPPGPTWLPSPGSGNWTTAGNWSAGGPPNDSSVTAAFGTSATTAVSISGGVEVNRLLFNTGASVFTITVNPASYWTISGVGIVNNSGTTQNFATVTDGGGNYGAIFFTGSAGAGSNTAFTAAGASAAFSSGGQVGFYNTATADHGTFTTQGGTAGSAGNAETSFHNAATAASGVFITDGATVANANGGYLRFYNTATAGSANVTTNGGTFAGASGGTTEFDAGTTAGSGTFTTNGATASGAFGGATYFTGTSTAANGKFITNAATVSDGIYGVVGFTDSSTAGNGTFTSHGSTVAGGFGAGVQFNATSTAADSTITTNGGTVGGANGAFNYFVDSSTAGNATLIANGGTGGGGGGRIAFFGDSIGGTARVEVFGNGFMDIGYHNAPGLAIGSIEGSGNVFLGANILTVGGNNLSTNVSGIIQDGGMAGGTGGGLVKTGTGTLTLSGSNTYTGATTVGSGGLVVNGSIAASSGVSVSAGATLSGHGTVSIISGDGLVSPGNSPGILTATQVDPTGLPGFQPPPPSTLSFYFQFTQLSPTYSDASNSGNDVLHLTGETPFALALTSSNTITVDFTGQILQAGEFYYGGFFTDTAVADSLVDGATFVYVGVSGVAVQYDGFVSVDSADFAGGTVTGGQVMKFGVIAIPEPRAWAMLAAGMGFLVIGSRRRVKG